MMTKQSNDDDETESDNVTKTNCKLIKAMILVEQMIQSECI